MLGDTAEQDHRFEIPHAEMAEILKMQLQQVQVQRQQSTACAGMSISNDAKKRHHEEGTTDTAMEEFLGFQRKSRNVEQVSCYIFNLSPNRNPEPSPNPNLNPDPNPT